MAERKDTGKTELEKGIQQFEKLDADAQAKYNIYREARKAANKVRDELVEKHGWEAPVKTSGTIPLASQKYMQDKMNRRHKMSAVQCTALIAIAAAPDPLTNNEVAVMLKPYVKFNSKDGDKSGGILRTLLLTLERNGALKTSYQGRVVVFGPTEHTKPLVGTIVEDIKQYGIEAFSKHENVTDMIDSKAALAELKKFREAEAAKKAEKEKAKPEAVTPTEKAADEGGDEDPDLGI